ncbi:hypothetical protein J3Q64DRAFT_1811979 [Phycomyces blakesleeanus]|uniref:Zn-dependent exopeptidase n=2 Tax=Phycomyces blakesleeanus TaxID=4837 RepID=A0ABR3BBP1_PHYBL
MSQGYSSLPRGGDLEDPSGSAGNNDSWINRASQWWKEHWGSSETENAPLLNKGKGSLEPPKTNNFKNIVTIVGAVIAFIIIGGIYVMLVPDSEKPLPSKRTPTMAEDFLVKEASGDSVHEYLKVYTSVSHLAGTENDKNQAEWTRDQFLSFGIDSKIETYWPMLNYPVQRRLAIISGPEEFLYEASLAEDIVEEDETSKNPENVPTFHGYSKNGSVTGPVVYANYGRLEDFEYLVSQGIELEGTIALMRYGGSFRGLKVKAAENYGCIGALVFSDPIDDGPLDKEKFPHTNPAESYPEGPWRSPSSAQRGSVLYLSLASGDPLTPGYAATENATRINPEDSPALAKIPSLPLSWRDALPLLKATQNRGVVGETDWTGGLNEVGYFSGPTEGLVNLVNIVDNKITPIWDVISRIEGSEEPDRAIILGNHRDAWVYGAVDPSSGSASMLELGRIFGKLLKTGWRPRRTIIFASWDAEEYALVGSTEWVEDNRKWLVEQAAVYINVDVGVSGPHFNTQASPSLSNLLYDVTKTLTDPRTGDSIYDTWGAMTNMTRGESAKPYVGPLGSGSDFVAFLDHLGIASIDMGFGGDYGVYHSNYDSIHWMEKFGDPTFKYHESIVKVWGLTALRLAEDHILPIRPFDYAVDLEKSVETLHEYAYPHVFFELEEAVQQLTKTSLKFNTKIEEVEAKLSEYSEKSNAKLPSSLTKQIAIANKRLTNFERGFIDPEGIKGREWFKHVIYAPGLWTGYSSQVFPAIADGLDAKNISQARHAEERAAIAIQQAAEYLKA